MTLAPATSWRHLACHAWRLTHAALAAAERSPTLAYVQEWRVPCAAVNYHVFESLWYLGFDCGHFHRWGRSSPHQVSSDVPRRTSRLGIAGKSQVLSLPFKRRAAPDRLHSNSQRWRQSSRCAGCWPPFSPAVLSVLCRRFLKSNYLTRTRWWTCSAPARRLRGTTGHTRLAGPESSTRSCLRVSLQRVKWSSCAWCRVCREGAGCHPESIPVNTASPDRYGSGEFLLTTKYSSYCPTGRQSPLSGLLSLESQGLDNF